MGHKKSQNRTQKILVETRGSRWSGGASDVSLVDRLPEVVVGSELDSDLARDGAFLVNYTRQLIDDLSLHVTTVTTHWNK